LRLQNTKEYRRASRARREELSTLLRAGLLRIIMGASVVSRDNASAICCC